MLVEVNPFMHTVVMQQQITTIELMKEQSKKQKKTKNKNIMYERVNQFQGVKAVKAFCLLFELSCATKTKIKYTPLTNQIQLLNLLI